MKDFSRMFIVKDGKEVGWPNEKSYTRFILNVTDNCISLQVPSGRDPLREEVCMAVGLFVEEYQKEYGDLQTYKRSTNYRFIYTDSSSGANDYYIETEEFHGFPKRRFILHESMYGKVSCVDCFVYDFLDLCVCFGALEESSSSYHSTNYEIEEGNMKVIRPRDTSREDGWGQKDRIYSSNTIVRLTSI